MENDNRGFVEEKGWAHAFAHGADLIASASRSVYFQEIEVVQCLEATRRALVDVGGSYMEKRDDSRRLAQT
ncbi:DUF2785 domain-containing protein [Erysipelothrix sp. D19-032]